MRETWRLVPGFEQLYQVSSIGRVRSIKYTRIRYLVPIDRSKNRYLAVRLGKNGKARFYSIHRLVLMAFHRMPVGKELAAHLNGDPSDNRVQNLKWASYSENEAHKELHGTKVRGVKSKQAKLTDEKVREMRALYASGMKKAHIAKRFGVTKQTAFRVIVGTSWAHVI